jgi:hypothetical protein
MFMSYLLRDGLRGLLTFEMLLQQKANHPAALVPRLRSTSSLVFRFAGSWTSILTIFMGQTSCKK